MITYFYNTITEEETYTLPKKWVYDGRTILNLKESNMDRFGWEKRFRESNIPEIDTTVFDNACEQFRELCGIIGNLIDDPDFKGGFDEIAIFEQSEAAQSIEGIQLSLKWMALDKLCTYEGSKIGLGQPDWWYRCWENN